MKNLLGTPRSVNASALLAVAGAIVGLVAVAGISAPAIAQDVFPFTDGEDGDGPGSGETWQDVAIIAPIYQLQPVGTLGGNESYATAISDNGWVVGGAKLANGRFNAIRMQVGGSVQSLGSLPGLNFSGGYSVNNNGDVVGVASSSSSLFGPTAQPWVYRNGQLIDIDPFDRGVYAAASSINDFGVVVGTTSFEGSGSVQGFRSVGTSITSLPGLVGDRCRISYGMGINHAGTIVGYAASPTDCGDSRAVRFPAGGGSAFDLGTLGGDNGQAQAINSFGDIVGFSELSTGQNRATLWNSSGPQNLGTLAGASFALDINDEGLIVGYYIDSNNQQRACVWMGGSMFDLNTLMGSGSTGWRLLIATGVNAQGQIVGQGRYVDRPNTAGRLLGFVLTPPCRSDYNQDGGIDGSDAASFFDSWSAGLPDTDLNLDGGIDGSDATFFMELWSDGRC
jgi:probable HAF family extracellular repeat protein